MCSLLPRQFFGMTPSRLRRFLIPALLAVPLLLGGVRLGQAHEIPERVAISMFVRAEGQRLRLLVRVPLAAMRDVDFPTLADGTIDPSKSTELLDEAAVVWLRPSITVFEDGRALEPGTVRAVSLAAPGDRRFETYESALAALAAPPPSVSDTLATFRARAGDIPAGLRFESAHLDVLLDYTISNPDARFAVEPALAHLGIRTTSVVRVVLPGGTERAFQYTGDPGRIELDPRWYQAARTFVALGFTHILDGIDHLLFVFCLVIPVRRWRPLVAIVSAFTVAHSLTLATAAVGFTPQALWFAPLVETLIAASIVFMAVENVLRPAEALERRWPIAFAFGLVHGFGFSFALQESLQFSGSHLAMSLAAFNVGVEFGQIAVLAVVVPALAFVSARVPRPQALVIVLSAFVAHSAWHWMTERGSEFLTYDLTLSAPSPVIWLGALRLALLAAVALAVAWGLSGVFDRLSGRSAADALRTGPETRVGAH